MPTITIQKDSLYLKAFLWAWGAKIEQLNICKLFWGTLFFPLAFVNALKVECKFIPRPSILYLAVAIVLLGFGEWKFAISFSIVSVLLVCIGYPIFCLVAKVKANSSRNDTLTRLTERAENLLFWVFDRPVGFIADKVFDASETRTGERISGFFGVFAEKIRGLKTRTCPMVRVE